MLKISFEQRILDNTATDFLPFFGTDIGFCRLEDNSNFQPRIDNSTQFLPPQSDIEIDFIFNLSDIYVPSAQLYMEALELWQKYLEFLVQKPDIS